MKKRIIIGVALLFLVGISLGYSILPQNTEFKAKSFEGKRNEILSEMDLTLTEATESGKYRCCIDPPCKMCFLGNWVWDDGTCDCDGMIVEEKWDKVCPECKAGIKEGRCLSTKTMNRTCPVVKNGE